jgi:hypothetical protein
MTITAAFTPQSLFGDDEFLAVPNPCRERVSFIFKLSETSRVIIDIYDISGTRVAHIDEPAVAADNSKVIWDCRGLAAGIYFARGQVQAGSRETVLKIRKIAHIK